MLYSCHDESLPASEVWKPVTDAYLSMCMCVQMFIDIPLGVWTVYGHMNHHWMSLYVFNVNSLHWLHGKMHSSDKSCVCKCG